MKGIESVVLRSSSRVGCRLKVCVSNIKETGHIIVWLTTSVSTKAGIYYFSVVCFVDKELK